MGLKILCAGCSKAEREQAEVEVKRVLGARARAESWTVSLVKLGRQWSVTLDGPEPRLRGASFRVDAERLVEGIGDALRGQPPGGAPRPAAPTTGGKSAPGPQPRPAVPGSAGERRDRHECALCGKPFVVTYEAEAGDSPERVAVACPHCWGIGHVQVSASAALNREYRAEKI